MLPEEFMRYYLEMIAFLGDFDVVQVSIRKYLNAKTIFNGTPPKDQSPRAKRAWKEKDAIMSAVAKEINVRRVPLNFIIEGWVFNLMGLVRAFTGKGAPSEIIDALWLADRYDRIGASTQDYCDNNLGLDCNGFVGNFWGVDPNNTTTSYDHHRRTDPAKIQGGDVLVHYSGEEASHSKDAAHVAAVGQVDDYDDSGNGKASVTMRVVQSGGPELGVHVGESSEWPLKKNRQGHLYWTGQTSAGLRTVYFCEGPPKNLPHF